MVHMVALNGLNCKVKAARRRHYITLCTAVHLLGPLLTFDRLLFEKVGLLLQFPDQIILL